MLHRLDIENYAVVETLRVDFHPGLNLLTGETGSGKSILVDAFSLLLGARASPEMIRAGAGRARVAGIFEVAGPPPGVELEEEEFIVEREILPNGRSRVYLNGRPATVAMLREIAPVLGDIHGQHEQQDLFSPQAQLEMLDQWSGTVPLRDSLASVFAQWTKVSARLETLRRNEQERLRLLDLWKFQHQEISSAGLQPGEDAALEEQKHLLANLSRIQQAGASAYDALYESPAAAAAQVKSAARALEEISRFDASFSPLAQSLHGARITLEETARELRRRLDRLDADPDRLGRIEDRLAAIEKLKRKYGATIEQILAFGEQVRAQIAEQESGEDSMVRLQEEQQRLASEYEDLAAGLSQKRKEGAARLEKPVEKELAALAMDRTRFQIAFETSGWSAQGTDRVQFLVSPNPGEPPRPLHLVASGGELSRITLAIKTCLAGSLPDAGPRSPRTLVFDEIDAGIGGRAAEAVGRRLSRLARRYQLLCVTHLPQIAGFADHHYAVDKQVKAGRTVATVTELEGQQRIRELARMLSGAQVTAEAIRHAEQLLEAARS